VPFPARVVFFDRQEIRRLPPIKSGAGFPGHAPTRLLRRRVADRHEAVAPSRAITSAIATPIPADAPVTSARFPASCRFIEPSTHKIRPFSRPLCLLCYERDPAYCHRVRLAAELDARLGLRVEHLRADVERARSAAAPTGRPSNTAKCVPFTRGARSQFIPICVVAHSPTSSWPGLSRPSTALNLQGPSDVDARDKRRHDESGTAQLGINPPRGPRQAHHPCAASTGPVRNDTCWDGSPRKGPTRLDH
jgi:hypothetical protein